MASAIKLGIDGNPTVGVETFVSSELDSEESLEPSLLSSELLPLLSEEESVALLPDEDSPLLASPMSSPLPVLPVRTSLKSEPTPPPAQADKEKRMKIVPKNNLTRIFNMTTFDMAFTPWLTRKSNTPRQNTTANS